MPRELQDEAGNKITVPTEEELTALQTQAAAAKEAESLKEQLETAKKEKEDLAKNIDPNWTEARKSLEEANKKVIDLQKQVDSAKEKEGGKEPKPLTTEDVERLAEAKAKGVHLQEFIDGALDAYGDKKDVVATIYTKLSTGEEMDKAKALQFIKQAALAAGLGREVSPEARANAASSGSAPRFEDTATDYSTTEAGKKLASAMGLSSAAKK